MDFEELAVAAQTDPTASKALYRGLWIHLRERWDEDISQSTIVIVHRKLREFDARGRGSFLRWVRGIARLEGTRSLVRRGRHVHFCEALSHVRFTPSTNMSSRIERRQRLAIIRQEMSLLVPAHQRAIEGELAGDDAAKLAEAENMSVPTARKLRSRARFQLRHYVSTRMMATRPKFFAVRRAEAWTRRTESGSSSWSPEPMS